MFSGIKIDGYEPNLDSYPYFPDGPTTGNRI
jgi:hypothetical protein